MDVPYDDIGMDRLVLHGHMIRLSGLSSAEGPNVEYAMACGLEQLIQSVLRGSDHNLASEEATKQGIVLPILNCLGWDSANVAEAEPHRWLLGGSRARIAWRLASV
jgi:hypothetical protein